MNRWSSLALFLLTSKFVPQNVHGHAFWAETNKKADQVTVVFSEHAGVAYKVVAKFATRVLPMIYNGVDAIYDVPLILNNEANLLVEDLTPPTSLRGYGNDKNDTPYFVSGFLDNGPKERFTDVKFSFGSQMYNDEADYENFFRQILKNVGDQDFHRRVLWVSISIGREKCRWDAEILLPEHRRWACMQELLASDNFVTVRMVLTSASE